MQPFEMGRMKQKLHLTTTATDTSGYDSFSLSLLCRIGNVLFAMFPYLTDKMR